MSYALTINSIHKQDNSSPSRFLLYEISDVYNYSDFVWICIPPAQSKKNIYIDNNQFLNTL